MSKHIMANELAEIVTGLLLAPELMGELDSRGDYLNFMTVIGEVIADHCGGEVVMANATAAKSYLTHNFDSPYIAVAYNDSIPSLKANVWQHHDFTGWEDECIADDTFTDEDALDVEDNAKAVRQQLQWLLIQKRPISDGNEAPAESNGQIAMILAALRHMQKSIERGDDLGYLDDIADTSRITAEDIDALCEQVNV